MVMLLRTRQIFGGVWSGDPKGEAASDGGKSARLNVCECVSERE